MKASCAAGYIRPPETCFAMDLKALVADQMGHFTPYDIGTALVAMLVAALLGFALGLVMRSGSTGGRSMAATAAVVTLAVSFVRASVPMSIALVAAVLLLRGGTADHDDRDRLLRLAAVAIGVGCGSGAAAVTAVLVLPLALLLRWATANRS